MALEALARGVRQGARLITAWLVVKNEYNSNTDKMNITFLEFQIFIKIALQMFKSQNTDITIASNIHENG